MRISDWSSDVCSSDLPKCAPTKHRELLRPGMQPVLAAFGVALALPDRHARLDLVDDVATGGEGGGAVRGGDADPDRDVADHEVAGAVHAARVEDVESIQRPGTHARAFGDRKSMRL